MMSKAAMLGVTLASSLSATTLTMMPEVWELQRASCWSGAFTEQRCCNGAGGDNSCWGRGEFTFNHCCPASGGGRGGGRGGAAALGRGRGSSELDHERACADLVCNNALTTPASLAAALTAAITTDAEMHHHLYFRATDTPTPPLDEQSSHRESRVRALNFSVHYRTNMKSIQSHDMVLVLAVIMAGYIALRRCQMEHTLWQERSVLRRAASDRRAAAQARDDAAATADAEIQQKRESLRARLREQNFRKKKRKAEKKQSTIQKAEEDGLSSWEQKQEQRPAATKEKSTKAPKESKKKGGCGGGGGGGGGNQAPNKSTPSKPAAPKALPPAAAAPAEQGKASNAKQAKPVAPTAAPRVPVAAAAGKQNPGGPADGRLKTNPAASTHGKAKPVEAKASAVSGRVETAPAAQKPKFKTKLKIAPEFIPKKQQVNATLEVFQSRCTSMTSSVMGPSSVSWSELGTIQPNLQQPL